ncbi:MAG: sodium-dependent transporter, partial [Acidobacteriota bacterium]
MQTTPDSPTCPASRRPTWSRWGFVFAASGSAIGLGNVVFFPANAYRYGGGGFYLPYLVALVVVGIPLLALELGLGHQQRCAYPAALGRLAGRRGEMLGWWALVNTTAITLYYVAILSWVGGMLIGSVGPLWQEATA